MATKSIFDRISDRATLTQTIATGSESILEQEAFLGQQIAPLYNTGTPYMKMKTSAEHAWGIGQFGSPEGTPQLIETPARESSEKIFAMLRQDEEVRVSPTHYEEILSSDESIAGSALFDFVELGQKLALRNARLTELKRWEAFLDNKVTESVNIMGEAVGVGTIVVPDYGIPSSHRVTAGVPWTNTADSDPIAEIKAWREVVRNYTGYDATKLHITEDDLELVLANENIKLYFNIVPGQPFLPTVQQIEQLISAGRGNFNFVTYDAGFRLQSAGADMSEGAHTRYLPIGKVLLTTNYTVGGVKIADTPNGKVDVMTGYNSAALVQGPVTEFYVDPRSKQRHLRYASRVIPRINVPGAFLRGTIR